MFLQTGDKTRHRVSLGIFVEFADDARDLVLNHVLGGFPLWLVDLLFGLERIELREENAVGLVALATAVGEEG